MATYKTGSKVSWSWGNGRGEGVVQKEYTSDVSMEIKGTEVSRNASSDEPAYLIEQDDGDQVLKSASELKSEE